MTSNNYENYAQWKNWGEKFGQLDNIQSKYYDLELSEVIKYYDKNSKLKVLEIGFGNGEFLEYSTRKGWETHGVEINQYLIKIGKERGFNVFESLEDIPDNYFDLIVGFDVIEHISNEEICVIFENLKNKLSGVGFFIFRFPNGDSPIGLKNQNGDLTHLNIIGSEKILQIANIMKLNVVVIRGEIKIFKKSSFKDLFFNIISSICAKILDRIVKFIFFRNTIYIFSSENLVVILKKDKK